MNELFGTLSDGTPVHRWTLQRAGVRVRILSYGGIVQSVEIPDRDGRTGNVVLGFAETEPIDQDKLKKRYRELAMRHHPDRPGGNRTKMEQFNAARDLIESLMEQG